MKTKFFSRAISLLLVLVMIVSISACGSKEEKVAASDSTAVASTAATTSEATVEGPGWKKDTTPITFDWYLNFSWVTNKWSDGIIPKYITKKTGVNINFIIPAGNEAEKLNTMIASNSLPDFVTLGWYEENAKKLVEGKMVYPLNELSKQYDPYFLEVAAKGTLGWYTQADGNIYGYPNFSVSPERVTKDLKIESNQTFLVKKDMYEALGKPDMRTPEGFLNALVAAKEKFPQVNGQVLIPFGAHEFSDAGNYSFEKYLQNFLAIPVSKDGKLYDALSDPEYIKWLKVFRKANEMGLISKDIFIDKRAQIEEKMGQGRYFSMMYQRTDCAVPQMALYKKDPNSVYIAVDGPANANLDQPTLSPGPGIAGWTETMISKNNKDPKRAISLMGYMLSEEGQKDFYLGEKGVTWDTIDGKDQFLPDVAKLFNSDVNAFAKQYAGAESFWMLTDYIYAQTWKPAAEEPVKQPLEWTYGKIVAHPEVDDINPAADSEEGIINKKISDKWGLVLPKLLLSKTDADFDKTLSDFITDREKLGYEKLRVYQQKRYEENKKKLGIN